MDTASLAAAPAAVAARDETKDERRKRKEKERGQRRNHSGRKQCSGSQKRKRQKALTEERVVAAEAVQKLRKLWPSKRLLSKVPWTPSFLLFQLDSRQRL